MKRRRSINRERPRIAVHRSNRFMYAQLIDDIKGMTIVSSDDTKATEKDRIKRAYSVGEMLAKKAIKKGASEVRFDKRQYRYHGRVKALAEGARAGGLKF